MAVALVKAGTVANESGSTISPTYGQPTTAGNLVTLLVAGVLGDQLPTTPSGWSVAVFANGAVFAAIYYKANCIDGETAPVITDPSVAPGTLSAILVEFSGVASSLPLDQTGATFNPVPGAPIVVTATGIDVAAGDLVLSVAAQQLTKAGTTTSVDTFNNGAAANAIANNDALSVVSHYRMSNGVTTGNGSADGVSETQASMNLGQQAFVIASFMASPPPGPPVTVLSQAVKRAASY